MGFDYSLGRSFARCFGVIVGFLVLNCLVTVSKADEDHDHHYHYRLTDYEKAIIGAWVDSKNRTIYVCTNTSDYYYFAVSRAGAPNQVDTFFHGNRSGDHHEDFEVKGEWRSLNSPKREGDPTSKGEFHIKRDGHLWTGEWKSGEETWDWVKRLYALEPAPSICLKPPPFEISGKVVGRWQRPTTNGDFQVIEICPNGEGRWQTAFALTGGRYSGDLLLSGYVFHGTKSFFTPNSTHITDGDIDMDDSLEGGQLFVQTGATILTEIYTNTSGYWVERQTFSYIGRPEHCGNIVPVVDKNFWYIFAIAALPIFVGLCFLVVWLRSLYRLYCKKYRSARKSSSVVQHQLMKG